MVYHEYTEQLTVEEDEQDALRTIEEDQTARQETRPIHRLLVQLIMTPALVLAVYIGVHEGIFSRQLWSPGYVLLGLVLGHVIFCLSLLLTPLAWTPREEHDTP